MDNTILDESLKNSVNDTSPFLRKEMVSLKDQASAGNYSSGTSVIETITLSNGGKWTDYHEAYLTIPVVVVVTGVDATNGVIDWEANHARDSDIALAMKNSNLNLINSCTIDYGNRTLVQATDRINDYLIFKQHTEMSLQDQMLHGESIGYHKDNGASWAYDAVNGIVNNFNVNDSTAVNYNEYNEGMAKRQEKFRNHASDVASWSEIFEDNANKKDNGNFITNTATYKSYHYNAVLRLKDLPVFNSLPHLMKGANFKITLTLNQCLFKFSVGATGALSFTPSTFSGKQTNPVMVARKQTETRVFDSANADQTDTVTVPGGSWTLEQGTYTVSCSVGKVGFSDHAGLNVDPCQESNIELHVPIYELKAGVEQRLIESSAQKRIVYNEVLSFQLFNKKGAFNELITNGISHLKRMIIIPRLNSAGNGTNLVTPHLSPFDTAPSTCSPYSLENFQVQVANHNIYHQAINYSYEMFLQEMNGRYGLESSLSYGESSSLINLRDYVNLYGYIVVDLKRKHNEDESVPLSIQISGNITSKKALDFFVFVEQEKSFTYDILTGARVS